MFFLDNESGVDVMPTIANKQSNTVKWFTEGDNVNPESWPGQDWFNMVQAELLNLLKEATIEPDKTSLNQLATAIKQLVAKNKVEIKDASLTQKGIVQLSTATDSDLETKAATSKAVKIVYDLVSLALKQGDYGIGGTAPIILDLDTIRQGGLYQTSSETLNTPFSGVWGVIHVNTSGNASSVTPSATQLAINYSAAATVYTRSATSGKWNNWCVQVNSDNINNYLPVGIPQPWPTTIVPTGWLKCNGSSFDKNLYPKLTTAYPTGILPDLRGEFIRGLDAGRGIDVNRVILSPQGDAMRNMAGNVDMALTFGAISSSGVLAYENPRENNNPGHSGNGWVGATKKISFDASRVVPTANENRPRNIAFLYIVKAE